ncbi:uncharacterized protein LOC122514594 [Polistes fuscatus]|uniref:uncharacterized protein LOC122514594 n=1 Tax=Polistes fuscatus TaxID=30207 RepID=UPI001CA83073|nr:uncharacterized protein LOC122514594 [Polistes fuscatus]XP_043487450.1 uncharacterized protein LOC122514594 [Polistes fuscatus]XP_043487451.1 uncharacterized protein LOC122514594 [Polistes fuscatus]XP_043487452.1 uncharacterized protein LOC122514594 [Polistes fuscatus]
MTRKCVLCKGTNYKNTCSFFSAPKDPELRRKWQAAIDIDNYSVSDDTYVCSKHFYKWDIITHWISGAPPHVVTIKYKKCRLRPGAVPIRNIHHQSKDNKATKRNHFNLNNLNDFLMSHNSLVQSIDKAETFLIPREEEIANMGKECFEFKNHKYENANRSIKMQQSSEDESNIKMSMDDYRTQLKLSSNRNNKHKKIMLRSYNNLQIKNTDNDMEKAKHKENIDYDQLSQVKLERSVNNSSYVSNYSEEDETSAERWDNSKVKIKNFILKKCLDNTLKKSNVRIKQQSLNILNNRLDKYDDYVHDEIREQGILFEDLLEMCFEVVLPRGWSCNVTSKGHATTIVYLNMAITKDGMPFLEKQVFVKTDMILRCSVLNREIDPIMYNLIRESKDNKVQCLLDIEELIDEFDLRNICEGITENFQENNYLKIACKDGIQWRHVLCPLILNNDSTRCSKCIMLSHMIKCKLRKSVYYKSNFNLRKKRKVKYANKHCTK